MGREYSLSLWEYRLSFLLRRTDGDLSKRRGAIKGVVHYAADRSGGIISMAGSLDPSVARALVELRVRSGRTIFLRRGVDGTESLSVGNEVRATFPPGKQSPEEMRKTIAEIADEG